MATTTTATRHTAIDNATGIGISDENGHIEITGLNLPADQLDSLAAVLDMWKSGLIEDTSDDGE